MSGNQFVDAPSGGIATVAAHVGGILDLVRYTAEFAAGQKK